LHGIHVREGWDGEEEIPSDKIRSFLFNNFFTYLQFQDRGGRMKWDGGIEVEGGEAKSEVGY
jgi:hypothetical protein